MAYGRGVAHALVRAASRLVSTPLEFLENFDERTYYVHVEFSHRRLPHFYPHGADLFVTFHLHGSLPASLRPLPGPLSSGEAFVWLDRQLDSARGGPMYLRQPEIAQMVADSIYKGVELGHFNLGAWVIMANHVHILIRPQIRPDRLLKSLKGVTARACNRILSRTGESFWQKESYDHCVRNRDEWERIRGYIENNPVKAGLVKRPEEYRWSSAGVEMSLDAARTSACATIPSEGQE